MEHSRFAAAFATIALLGPQQAGAAAWSVVGTQGIRHFVAVDAAQANEAVYRQAASGICAPGKPCIVLFWTDSGQAAAQMPLTRAQRDALAAQYTRNPATGQDVLLLRCPPGSQQMGRCLK